MWEGPQCPDHSVQAVLGEQILLLNRGPGYLTNLKYSGH
jgi:hypothetical protein